MTINQAGIEGFCIYMKYLHDMLLNGKSDIKNDINTSPKQYNQFADIAKTIGNNSEDSSLSITGRQGNDFYAGCTINHIEVRTISENANAGSTDSTIIHYEKLFKWNQANFESNTRGNKAVIADVYQNPLKVVFSNDRIKKELTENNNGASWQEMYYFVDVSVNHTLDNNNNKLPSSYTVTKTYPDKSYPIE